MNLRNNLRKKERKLMPKFKLLVDVDSVVDEAEHLNEGVDEVLSMRQHRIRQHGIR